MVPPFWCYVRTLSLGKVKLFKNILEAGNMVVKGIEALELTTHANKKSFACNFRIELKIKSSTRYN